MDFTVLPPVNATLNGLAAVLLVAGYVSIRRRRVAAHRNCMISAFVFSVLFLACYVTYHAVKQRVTGQGHTPFTATGPIRAVYFAVLISHLLLAIANLPMVLLTLYRAARGRFELHARIARWTLPIWLYVSVTGVIVYTMLYHLAPLLQEAQ